jgi:L-alanine-DL-glutamate epimerase-like enolase superfamily enzyme
MRVGLLSLEPAFELLPFASPLKIGSGLITTATCLTVHAAVQTEDGHRGEGQGAILLSHVWAWPGPGAPAEKDEAMRQAARRYLSLLLKDRAFRSPVDWYLAHEADIAAPGLPLLASAVAASPVDAAIHDAAGKALGCSSYDLLPDWMARCLLPGPAPGVPVMHTVGLADSLQSLAAAVAREGIYGFKVKLSGHPATDADRTTAVFDTVSRAAGRPVFLSSDGNESYRTPAEVEEYLSLLPERAERALLFVEQPISRSSPYDMGGPARRKPMLADEGWATPADLRRLLALGWSGAVLKTCKGHTSTLVSLSLLEAEGRPYAVQDLTNPGIALTHSLGLAARCRPLGGLEANARQYLPEHHPAAFPVRDGVIATTALRPAGLGY